MSQQTPFSLDFINTLTRDELQQIRIAVDKRLSSMRNEEVIAADIAMKEIASRLGYTDPQALMNEASQIKISTKPVRKSTKTPRSVSVRKAAIPRYWNPDNKSQTWCARGKQPRWLINILAETGNPLDFYLIPDEIITEMKAKQDLLESQSVDNVEQVEVQPQTEE